MKSMKYYIYSYQSTGLIDSQLNASRIKFNIFNEYILN